MKDVDFTDECSRSVHTIWKKECSSLARQTVNVHQRRETWTSFILLFFTKLTCKSGRNTSLANRLKQNTFEAWKSSEIFALNSPSARSVNLQKFLIWAARAESCGIWAIYVKTLWKLNFVKKLFRKLSRDNLCERSLNSVLPPSILQTFCETNSWGKMRSGF